MKKETPENETRKTVSLVHSSRAAIPQVPLVKLPSHPLKTISIGMTDQGTRVGFDGQSIGSHVHIIGATRYGKSKLVEHILRQKFSDRKGGVILIDPHGTLYNDLRHYISHRAPHLAKRVIFFDPAGGDEHLLAFNPIPKTAKINTSVVVSDLVDTCLRAWKQDNADQTPRIRRYLENIFYTLIVNDLTIIESLALIRLSNEKMRRKLVALCETFIQDDWETFDEIRPKTKKMEYIEGAANRLRKFLLNPRIRLILGSKKSSIDIASIMKEGKILLVNLHGGDLVSHDNMTLLGSLLLSEIFRCARLRDAGDRNLLPCDIIIDEFPEYVNRSVARILDQAGKWKCWLWLMHQHLDQLETSDSEDNRMIASSIKTNCQTKIVFGGLSRNDAELLSLELYTGFMNIEEKGVKEELYSTKQRHVEDMWEVLSTSYSHTKGKSSTTSEGTNRTISKTKSLGKTEGKATGKTWGDSSTDSSMTGSSFGSNSSSGTSSSFSESGPSNFYDSNREMSSRGSGESRSHSSSEGFSHGSSWSSSSFESYTESQSQSETQGEGKTKSKGTNSSLSQGTSSSKSEGNTLTYQRFFRPIEYKELASRTFWRVDERKEIAIGWIKNLPKQFAVLKIAAREPIIVKIDTVEPSPTYKRGTPDRIRRFEARVRDNNPGLYQSILDIEREINSRHLSLFGEVLYHDRSSIDSLASLVDNEGSQNYVDRDESTDSSSFSPSGYDDGPFNR